MIGLDKIAVMAALNLAAELLSVRSRDTSAETGLAGKIRQLRERVETALNHGQQMEI